MPASPWVALDGSTIPGQLARQLRDAWEDFVDDSAERGSEGAGTPGIRVPIADSWLRSRDAGVDPSGRQAAPSVFEGSGARDVWSHHPLAAAAPVIDQCLEEAAVGADHLLVVSDADGVLLNVRGDLHLRGRAADDMNFVEGALWSESGAGTNAVGTAVAAGHAVQVFAAEHFLASVQRWTCSAAPIFDPDSGRLLGVVDLTGDLSTAHPHSLAVVVATARAVEGHLREQMHARDDCLRDRYADRLGPGSAGGVLVTPTGRVLMGRIPDLRHDDVPLAIPTGGGQVLLPSGGAAIAEPIGDVDAYLVRSDAGPPRPARRHLTLRVLGRLPVEVRLDGTPLPLRRRHVELLTLLALRQDEPSADVLAADLYGDAGHPGSVRVEMSRLRKLLGSAIDTDRYRLRCHLELDVTRVQRALARNATLEAAQAYPGPLLPDSVAPGIERARDELEGWLRQAVLTSDNVDALWAWVQTPGGEEDLLAWQRLLVTLDYADARRPRVAAHTSALRQSFSL